MLLGEQLCLREPLKGAEGWTCSGRVREVFSTVGERGVMILLNEDCEREPIQPVASKLAVVTCDLSSINSPCGSSPKHASLLLHDCGYMIKDTRRIVHHESRFGTASGGASRPGVHFDVSGGFNGLVGWGKQELSFSSCSSGFIWRTWQIQLGVRSVIAEGPSEVGYTANSSGPSTDPSGTTVER